MNQYLQIDLSIDHVVTGVATQGRDDTQFTQWVKTYQLQYSKDGSVTWEYYKEDTAVKVLPLGYDKQHGILDKEKCFDWII